MKNESAQTLPASPEAAHKNGAGLHRRQWLVQAASGILLASVPLVSLASASPRFRAKASASLEVKAWKHRRQLPGHPNSRQT